MDEVTGGASLGGFADMLNQILNSDQFSGLREQRLGALNAGFGKSGMLGSGQRAEAIANDLTDFGLGIEELLYGRQSGLVNNAQNAASGLGAFGQNSANAISQLQQGIGESRAGGILGSEQVRAGNLQQLLGLGTSALGGALAGGAGLLGSGVGAGGGAGLAMLFSDRRLKENIRPVGEIGPLTVYDWDWIPEVKDLGLTMTRGFIADEVEAVFPKYVHNVGKFKAIDYQGLMDKLDEVLH
jgi:hypothetical protein